MNKIFPLLVLMASLGTAATTSHSATLNWVDPQGAPPLNPVGTLYNVYRAATATCSGTPAFTKIAGGIAAKTFVDSTVAASTSYCYTVTATNSAGESAQSNFAAAVVPADLVTPTGLTAVVLVVTGP